MSPIDVSGTWYARIENNAVNCNAGEYVDAKAIVISQSGTEITMLTSTGDQFVGTVNGDIVEWNGSYPQWNGTADYTSTSMEFDAESGVGNAAWTWSDGVDSCNGTMAMTFSRLAGGESASNSSADSADPFEFTDSVAFFQGSLGVGIDKYDYFAFTATADASLQIELSHFDTANSNLDLELRNGNDRRIVQADTLDNFEIIDAPVSAGRMYFIKVEAESIAGPDTYNLSIDFN